MTTLTLHGYLQKIDQLLDDNRFSEAASHCRHILEQYPRHIETYRLLAKALLEQRQYENAADLFQRVLSADPNDLLAHVGLADIYKHDVLLDQSLWHLERAFELEPYSHVIQDELRRLYVQRHDITLERIPLNQGALARIYLRQELYRQAASEARQALSRNGDRVDLEVVLAEALWRDEQRVDAAEVCQHVLEQLPNCITANAILADTWLQSGRPDEAQQYLQRLQALTQMDSRRLDVETVVGHAFGLDDAPSLPDAVTIELLTMAPEEAAPAAPTADWVSEVTFPSETAEPPVVTEVDAGHGQLGVGQPEVSYDWLTELDEATEPALVDSDFEDVAGLFGEGQPLSLDEVSDGDLESIDSTADMPSWLNNETAAEVSPEDVPDWLSEDMAGSEPPFDEEAAEPAEIPSSMEHRPMLPGEMPDWLADVSSADDFEPMEVDPMLASEWFGEAQDEATEGQIDSTASVGGQPEVADDWLAELAEHYGADSGELDEATMEAGPAATGEDDPESAKDWLTAEFEESLFQEGPTTGERDPGSDDDWLAALTRDTDELPAESEDWLAEATTDTKYGDEVTDWLLGSDLTEPDELEEVMAGIPAGLPADDSDKNDSSLQDGPEAEDELSDELDDAMAWLDALTAEQDEPEPSVMEQLAGEALPDWLADLSGSADSEAEMAAKTASEYGQPEVVDDIPDWLRASSLEGELFGPEEEAEAAIADEGESLSPRRIDEPPTPVSMTTPDAMADEDETELAGWLSELELEGSQDEDTQSLDWLDQLAAGAQELPVADQVPTLAWSDELDEEEPSLDWLSELAAAPDDTLVNLGQAQVAEESAQDDQAEEADRVAEVPRQPSVADLDDAMAWLEELAAQQGAPVEELPTVANVLERDMAAETADEELGAEPDLEVMAVEVEEELVVEEADVGLPEPDRVLAEAEIDLDEAMAWLEELVGQQDTAGEMWAEETGPEEAEPAAAADVTTAQDELEEALDWLEQAALQEGTLAVEAVGEPPKLENGAVEVTDDELEEALDWLEQLALGEPEAILNPRRTQAVEAVMAEDEPEITDASDEEILTVAAELVEPEDNLSDVPDDPEAALAWLEQAAAASEAEFEAKSESEASWDVLAEVEEADEASTPAELPQPFVAESSQADEEEAELELDFLADMPDDPDEAMAWLERLAARQGAPLEELPSISAEEDEDITGLAETMPGWLEAEAAIEEAEVFPQGIDEAEATEDIDAMGWLEGEAAEEVELVNETGATEDIDVMGWLEAEEEATVISSQEPARLPETGPLFEAVPEPPAAKQPSVEQPLVEEREPEFDVEDESLVLAELEPVTSALALDEAQLAQARQALADADYDEAMHTYQSLVMKGEGLITLIGDLETAVDRYPQRPLLRRVLGDAYMRNGQLQKALETYRQTLDQL